MSRENRQAGEAVAWLRSECERLTSSGSRTYSGTGIDSALANAAGRIDLRVANGYRAVLDHLEQVSRERDEAVDVIRAINRELAGMAHSNGRSMRAENVARAFLASIEARK